MSLDTPTRLSATIVPALFCWLLPHAAAQTASKPPTGAISGHVICADTQAPARFATVVAIMLPAKDAGSDAAATITGHQYTVNTGAEGEYVLTSVPFGDYLVVPELDGYVTRVPGLNIDNLLNDEDNLEALEKLADTASVSHVVANKTTRVDLTLQRGGTIRGTVTYDDGSPAIGISIEVEESSTNDSRWHASSAIRGYHQIMADSQGKFTVSGIPPGKFLISATLPFLFAATRRLDNDDDQFAEERDGISAQLRTYSPNTPLRSAAKPIDIDQDEQHVDIEIPIQSTLRIDGHIITTPPMPTPASGSVVAKLKDDPEFHRRAFIHADGSFHFRFLPPGSYTLTTAGLSSQPITISHSYPPPAPTAPLTPPITYPPTQTLIELLATDLANTIITIPPAPAP